MKIVKVPRCSLIGLWMSWVWIRLICLSGFTHSGYSYLLIRLCELCDAIRLWISRENLLNLNSKEFKDKWATALSQLLLGNNIFNNEIAMHCDVQPAQINLDQLLIANPVTELSAMMTDDCRLNSQFMKIAQNVILKNAFRNAVCGARQLKRNAMHCKWPICFAIYDEHVCSACHSGMSNMRLSFYFNYSSILMVSTSIMFMILMSRTRPPSLALVPLIHHLLCNLRPFPSSTWFMNVNVEFPNLYLVSHCLKITAKLTLLRWMSRQPEDEECTKKCMCARVSCLLRKTGLSTRSQSSSSDIKENLNTNNFVQFAQVTAWSVDGDGGPTLCTAQWTRWPKECS